MDFERNKKRQTIKVLISEFFMVIAVILTVVVLVSIVSGYWINANFEVGRSGLLQVSSMPTGATVTVDGNTWFQRTNAGRMVASGEHVVKITREGYDSWTKTVNVSEGLLYRLHYPRLFLKERAKETALDFDTVKMASVSPKHNFLLINSGTTWQYVNLDSDKLAPREVALAEVLGGEVAKVDWSKDEQHIIVKTVAGKWVLADLYNLKNSINLSDEFGVEFSMVKMLDDAASDLLVVENGNLRKIDVMGRAMSNILAEKVEDFDYFENEVVFSAIGVDGVRYVGDLKLNEGASEVLLKTNRETRVAIVKFYDNKYFAVVQGEDLTLYRREKMEPVFATALGFLPEEVEVGYQGGFLVCMRKNAVATLDMEPMKMTNWETDGAEYGWIDNNMIYSIREGKLVVHDYDGLNRREVATGATAGRPAMITDDRWMYYFEGDKLVREWLIPR